MNGSYYMDEQTLREIIEMIGKTAAAACVSAFLSEVVLKAAVSAQPTKIVLENGIPASVYTVGTKDKPSAVYVTTRRSKVDWRPVLFFGAVFAGCKYVLDYREKNVANVK